MKIALATFAITIFIGGAYFIVHELGWLVFIGLTLLLWANNIEQKHL